MRRLRCGLLCSVGTVAVALTCVYANQAKSNVPGNQVPNLLERIASLESRVAELEKGLLNQTLLRYQHQVPTIPHLMLEHPPAAAHQETPSGIPPGLTPHQFNGGTYYIIPLTKEASE